MAKTRILIADDHDVVRSGLRVLLRSVPDFSIVGEAADGREAVEKARHLRPDVVVMDIAMPELDGFQVLELEEDSGEGFAGLMGRRVSKQDVIYATSQLAIMVDTGITLSSALALKVSWKFCGRNARSRAASATGH